MIDYWKGTDEYYIPFLPLNFSEILHTGSLMVMSELLLHYLPVMPLVALLLYCIKQIVLFWLADPFGLFFATFAICNRCRCKDIKCCLPRGNVRAEVNLLEREKKFGIMARERKHWGMLFLALSIVSLHSNILLSFWLIKWEMMCLEHLRLDVSVGRFVCLFC